MTNSERLRQLRESRYRRISQPRPRLTARELADLAEQAGKRMGVSKDTGNRRRRA